MMEMSIILYISNFRRVGFRFNSVINKVLSLGSHFTKLSLSSTAIK